MEVQAHDGRGKCGFIWHLTGKSRAVRGQMERLAGRKGMEMFSLPTAFSAVLACFGKYQLTSLCTHCPAEGKKKGKLIRFS